MANLNKGEAEFEALGKRWHLCIDHNAWAEIEYLLDLNPQQFLKLMHEKQQVRYFRALLFASLRGRHPDVTLEMAGDLLSEGEIIGDALARALTAAMPELKEAASDAAANPPLTTGTGKPAKKGGRQKG